MAHLLLDRLRDGALVPYPVVTAALIVTGDLAAPPDVADEREPAR